MSTTKDQMVDMYTTMQRIRRFEEKVEELVLAGKLGGFCHLYVGEEAIAAGVCAALGDADYLTSTHRGHGHMIAKGGDVKFMMAELSGKTTGYCKGKGGSMHIADLDLGILGANGIVGAGPPLAVGAALALQYKNTENVCVSFFGDGASNQGTVHEAMNFAAVFKLPVVFVAENNQYGEHTPQRNHQCIESIAERAQGYDIPGVAVDGNDVMAVYEAASEAVTRARQGKGPAVIECKTYRQKGHFVGDPQVMQPKEEIESWRAQDKDPILRFKKHLLDQNILQQNQIDDIDAAIEKEIETSVSFAEESAHPVPEDLMRDVYAG